MTGILQILASLVLITFVLKETSGAELSSKDDVWKELADVLKGFNSDYSREVDNVISNDVAVEMEARNEESTCKNVLTDDQCFEESKKGLCDSASIKSKCPRTCLDCCADFDVQICKGLKKMCFVPKWEQRMKHLCPKTCEYCGQKMPAPPPCLSSKFGCCWDKSTAASAKIGSGADNCPLCKNVKDDVFCERFKTDCLEMRLVKGKQIRSYCPKTCRLCGKSAICTDHESQRKACPIYKAEGSCESSSTTMRYWCSKTCGFCGCRDNPVVNCEYLKMHKACTSSADRMKKLCPATCGFCKGIKTVESGNNVFK